MVNSFKLILQNYSSYIITETNAFLVNEVYASAPKRIHANAVTVNYRKMDYRNLIVTRGANEAYTIHQQQEPAMRFSDFWRMYSPPAPSNDEEDDEDPCLPDINEPNLSGDP